MTCFQFNRLEELRPLERVAALWTMDQQGVIIEGFV
jgi:hypothetical protein